MLPNQPVLVYLACIFEYRYTAVCRHLFTRGTSKARKT